MQRRNWKNFSLRKNVLIKLLSADDFSFKQILAVTFTNNALMRWNSQYFQNLYIQQSKNSKLAEINKEVEIRDVQKKSNKLLRNILNNFSFFQSVHLINLIIINQGFSPELRLGYDFEHCWQRGVLWSFGLWFLDKIEKNKPFTFFT